MSSLQEFEAMNLARSGFSEDQKADFFSGDSAISCSICLECVVDQGERSTAKLQCGHQFHLDCIGSAFNAKGAMQCPNCRKVEKGHWLYANGYRSLAEFNVDEWVHEDLYDLSYSELPFGLQWCPFRGFTQLSSLFEEGESQSNAYHDLLATAAFGDHSSASSSAHLCPYLALHGFPHPIHSTSTNTTDTVADSNSFHRHLTGLGGPPSGDLLNSYAFTAAEHHHNWQQPSLPFPAVGGLVNNSDQSASQLPSRLPRNDSNGQQRLGSFIHPLPFLPGSVTRTTSNIVGSLVPPILGDARSHHTRAHSGHLYQQQSASSPAVQAATYAPIRRMGPRSLALISSVGISSSAENDGFYGFSVSGSVSRNRQDTDSIGRRFDQFHGWGREGFAPLPWVPVDGESQWWGPFLSNHNLQTGNADSMSRSYFPHRIAGERGGQGRQESGYPPRVHLPRMSHFM